MQTRHLNKLMFCLERVADIGVAEVRKNELRKWYSQERISANVWRDIEEKWHEVLRGEGCNDDKFAAIPLLVGDSAGLYVFVYGGNLRIADPADKADGWLWPITDWMKPKDRKPAKSAD